MAKLPMPKEKMVGTLNLEAESIVQPRNPSEIKKAGLVGRLERESSKWD